MQVDEVYGKYKVVKIINARKAEVQCLSCGKTSIKYQHAIKLNIYGCHQCKVKELGLNIIPDKRIYFIYHGIRNRCINTDNPAYLYYGGRGIDICQEWLNNPIKFYTWSLENNYQENLEIDRKDNNLGYSPENCRWVTIQQNSFNRGSKYDSTSQYKGVSFDPRNGKWLSVITHNRKKLYLGRHNNEIDAARIYNIKAIELYGEFAHLNNIPTTVDRCFLDLDGTLCQFFEGSLKVLGTNKVPLDKNGRVPWNYFNLLGRSEEEFFNSLDRNFWLSLEKTPQADEIIRRVTTKFGTNNVCIFTKLPKDNADEAFLGKQLWIEKHYPQFTDQVLYTCGGKHFVASDRSVLIDDGEHNTIAYVEHGGFAILVPALWNSNSGKDVMVEIISGLDNLPSEKVDVSLQGRTAQPEWKYDPYKG